MSAPKAYCWTTISLDAGLVLLEEGTPNGLAVDPPPGYELHSWMPSPEPGLIILCWKCLPPSRAKRWLS